jgi:hypothetical protein
MSIIGRVGRQSFKVRALNASLHIILLLGSVTMVYPFLLMISSSFKSAVDSTRLDLVPGRRALPKVSGKPLQRGKQPSDGQLSGRLDRLFRGGTALGRQSRRV